MGAGGQLCGPVLIQGGVEAIEVYRGYRAFIFNCACTGNPLGQVNSAGLLCGVGVVGIQMGVVVTVAQSFIADISDATQPVGDAGDAVDRLVGAITLVNFQVIVLETYIVGDGVGVVVKEDMSVIFIIASAISEGGGAIKVLT